MSDDNTQSAAGAKKAYFVDEDTCIGCSICVSVCPQGYQMKENGKSETTLTDPTDDPAMQEALEACPVGAIKTKE